jgi:hypothetical protein
VNGAPLSYRSGSVERWEERGAASRSDDPGLIFAGGFGGGAGPAAAMDRAELTNEQVSAWGCLPASQTRVLALDSRCLLASVCSTVH